MKERRETNMRWDPRVFSSLQDNEERRGKLLILLFLLFCPSLVRLSYCYFIIFMWLFFCLGSFN